MRKRQLGQKDYKPPDPQLRRVRTLKKAKTFFGLTFDKPDAMSITATAKKPPVAASGKTTSAQLTDLVPDNKIINIDGSVPQYVT